MTVYNEGVGATTDLDNGTMVDLRGYDPVVHNLVGYDVMHQDRAWRGADGIVVALTDMGAQRRRNLLAWMRRNAVGLAWKEVELALTGPLAARGEMAMDAESDWATDVLDNPQAWLEGCEIVKKLVELVSADERIRIARQLEDPFD